MRPPTARRPAGMVVYVVLAIGALIGAALLLYHASFRHRDQQVRLGTDRAQARFMARGALETLRYAIGKSLEAPPSDSPNLRGGPIGDVLLNDDKGLVQVTAQRTSGRRHRAYLEDLLGGEAFAPLDRWLGRHKEATLTFEVTMTATPPPDRGLVDPVIKTANIVLESTCTVRHGRETYRVIQPVRVYSQLPAVTSRFTLTATGLSATVLAGVASDATGGAAPGPQPVLLFNSPDDLPPGVEPLGDPSTPARPLGTGSPPSDITKARQAFARKGFVYLSGSQGSGSGADGTAVMRLAAGGRPLGQYFQVYRPPAEKTVYPRARRLSRQPPRIEDFRPLEPPPVPPTRTPLTQAAFVQGAAFGYYVGIDAEGLLGSPARGEPGGDSTSLVRPFGSAAHPSPTIVYGPARAGLAAMSDLAVDRDESGRDEADQAAAVGRPLPVRESIDPFLAHASESEFAADIAREEGGLPPVLLKAFRSPGLPPGSVQNLNARVDLDEDGAPETDVPTEIDFSPLHLDLTEYRYKRLFGAYDEYQRVMSRRLSIPYNSLLRMGMADIEQTSALVERIAFGGDDTPDLEDDLLTEARFEPVDPVHQAIASGGAGPAYVDTRGQGPSGLEGLVRTLGNTFEHPRIVVKGVEEFRGNFLKGNTLDLQGAHVQVFPAKAADPPIALDLEDVEVAPDGGGVLEADHVIVTSVRNPSTGSSFVPLILKPRTLTLDGRGPFEAVLVLEQTPQFSGNASHALVKGAVVALAGDVLGALARPLAVVYDPRIDPIGPQAHLHYRFLPSPVARTTYYRLHEDERKRP